MSDYDSGDDLLDDVDIEDLLRAGSKRPNPDDHYGQSPNKRVDTKASADEQCDAIARSILKQKFGYDDFRHEQAAAIRAILRGENALVVFPTGAGKSLCYQIPAIAFEEIDAAGLTVRQSQTASRGAGITIVVSPLISLMKDQVDALHRRGLSAACLDSTKTYEEHKEIHASMHNGRLRILYCAPEKLNNEVFVESIKCVPGGIRLVAVDEAHCISEWGHSFRPDYLKVARFVSEIKAERVICLTATATTHVAEDVRKAFDISKSNVFRTPVYRPNLHLHAEGIIKQADKLPLLLKFLQEHDGPTIVYITAQRQTEELAAVLAKKGHKAAAFHAGLDTAIKLQTQDAFMAGTVRIVVATIAFGMGIDKADVRNIVHYNVASSIEEYSQQVGRAGRDGKPSFCTTYLCRDDFWLKETYIRGDLPSRRSIQTLLEGIFLQDTLVKYPDGTEAIRVNLNELSATSDIKLSPLSIIFATIELRYGLIRAITPEYSTYKFVAEPEYVDRIHRDTSPEAKAIARLARKAIKWYTIDPQAAANASGRERQDILRKLDEFHGSGLIKLSPSGVLNRYRVLKKLPSTRQEVSKITDKLFTEMESREVDSMKRFEAICDLLAAKKCFALSLSEYFGMQLPERKAKCGHCAICRTGRAITLPPKRAPPLNVAGIKSILAACDVRDDPRLLARIAFGIKSPRITKLKLSTKAVFGSLEDHDFLSLLKEFTKACEKEGYRDTNFG